MLDYITIKFENVDREFQAAVIQSNEENGDDYTIHQYWGSTYGREIKYRDLGDGEKTLGIIDWDGRWAWDQKSQRKLLLCLLLRHFQVNLLELLRG